MSMTITDPEMPFEYPLAPGLEDVEKITIRGRPTPGGNRFSLYFQEGAGYEPPNIAFHMDVRFNFGSCHEQVITNDKKGNNWGAENIPVDFFPFYQGEEFKIKIKVYGDHFKVKVNGEHLFDWYNDLPIDNIDTFRIDNDVELDEVKLK